MSDEGTHEGRLFDKEVTTLGVSDKEKRGTGLKKIYNLKWVEFLFKTVYIGKQGYDNKIYAKLFYYIFYYLMILFLLLYTIVVLFISTKKSNKTQL